MFKNKKILITGGTGSFGSRFIKNTLEKYDVKKIVVFSRDEMKQWNMQNQFNDNRLKYTIGDVKDFDSIKRACSDIDFVIHAAATKIVPTAEYNPLECVKTNINGAINVIEASKINNVKKVIALSTDKACNPINLYGASKFTSDKLFIAANNYEKTKMSNTLFSVVRYGNVMGSRGSVLPFFYNLKNKNYIPVTDKRMTRFMISLDECVDLVWQSFSKMIGGEIFIKKIPSIKIIDLVKAISSQAKIKIIGIRPGEKIHEIMITEDDSLNTLELKDQYIILPSINELKSKIKKKYKKSAKTVSKNFEYTSKNNSEWMSIKDLKNWIKNNLEILDEPK